MDVPLRGCQVGVPCEVADVNQWDCRVVGEPRDPGVPQGVERLEQGGGHRLAGRAHVFEQREHLAVVDPVFEHLRRCLDEIEAELATDKLEAAEKWRLRLRAGLIRSLLTR